MYDIGFTDAATLEVNKKYAIFLDTACFSSLPNFKEALAHEIGHCATGCTHRTSSPLDLLAKHEYKANRWAIERYLPFDALREAIQEGYTETWDLAEYFDVPENFIQKAIRYYTEARGMKFSA